MVWNDDESSGDEIEGLNCSGDTKQLFFSELSTSETDKNHSE